MKERHLLALSGGKDSAALAVYMREHYPHLPMEYVFIDSGCELPETYAYLDRLRTILGINIIRIGGTSSKDRKDFYYWLKMKNNYLPSIQNRWCTEVLKLFPYAKWLKTNCTNGLVHSYVGLRADERSDRSGYVTNGEKVIQHHPFVKDGLVYSDIQHILGDCGLGFPDYYHWRTRSGCFFCFFQTKSEWIGLYKNHPDLFMKASALEKYDPVSGKQFTWNDDISLLDLLEKYKSNNNYCKTSESKEHNRFVLPKLKGQNSEYYVNNLSAFIRERE